MPALFLLKRRIELHRVYCRNTPKPQGTQFQTTTLPAILEIGTDGTDGMVSFDPTLKKDTKPISAHGKGIA